MIILLTALLVVPLLFLLNSLGVFLFLPSAVRQCGRGVLFSLELLQHDLEEYIARRGEIAHQMFFIARGLLSVLVPGLDKPNDVAAARAAAEQKRGQSAYLRDALCLVVAEVNQLKLSDFFGEIALIKDCVRTPNKQRRPEAAGNWHPKRWSGTYLEPPCLPCTKLHHNQVRTAWIRADTYALLSSLSRCSPATETGPSLAVWPLVRSFRACEAEARILGFYFLQWHCISSFGAEQLQ